ncbi:hypothetical protein [Bacillus sp. T33-2]|uniref:hypothetical protein n=1 Tax=Bacillus sp. T33-2 TaxID=2054168 RepID=UPI000C78C7B3|nr:hypothetical protein [Bacillus sp. T33-2]PLR94442.1 hypothetical protein CVD19_17290 [Bacillus sp. T33-2]
MKRQLKTIIIVALVVVAGGFSYASANHKSDTAPNVVDHEKKLVNREIASTIEDLPQPAAVNVVTAEMDPVATTTPEYGSDDNLSTEIQKSEPASADITSESLGSTESTPNEKIANPLDQLQTEHPAQAAEEALTDVVVLDGQRYESLMDEEKFSHKIHVALKYGAKLYAVSESDVFAIVKDGVPIVHMSTGAAAAKPGNHEVLCDLFSDHGEYAAGIADGIKHVAQTGEQVEVGVTPETAGYAIFMNDDWLVVSW